MVPSRIVAQECIAILTSPLLARFLELLRDRDEAWCTALAARLNEACGEHTPAVWEARLNISEAPAAYLALMHGTPIALGELLRDGTERSRPLDATPLLVTREGKDFLLPGSDFTLVAGDRLLLAGRLGARRNLEFTLDNANELDYVLFGREDSGTWFGRWLAARTAGGQGPA
jgi:hypothetical protein